MSTARRRLLRAALLAAVLPLLAGGCITRPVKTKVFDDGYTQVYLRSMKRGTETIPQGFDHPMHIASVRIAHILSRIDLRRGDDNERVPAIPLDTLFTIADGIAKALAEADPDQEVVVQSIRRGKSLKIFERQYLTSLLCYLKDSLLYIHISRSDWEVEKRREDRLPETYVGEHPLDFRLVSDRAMALVDHQSVAVDWRDPIFRKPTRTRVTASGRVVRRQVLMESLEDDTDYGPDPRAMEDLTPDQLRALADLEEERREGEVSEAQYNARRNQILRGEGPAPQPSP